FLRNSYPPSSFAKGPRLVEKSKPRLSRSLKAVCRCNSERGDDTLSSSFQQHMVKVASIQPMSHVNNRLRRLPPRAAHHLDLQTLPFQNCFHTKRAIGLKAIGAFQSLPRRVFIWWPGAIEGVAIMTTDGPSPARSCRSKPKRTPVLPVKTRKGPSCIFRQSISMTRAAEILSVYILIVIRMAAFDEYRNSFLELWFILPSSAIFCGHRIRDCLVSSPAWTYEWKFERALQVQSTVLVMASDESVTEGRVTELDPTESRRTVILSDESLLDPPVGRNRW
ncbi:hypothetical protein IAQ61_011334, partial [Plenodomus lingam]